MLDEQEEILNCNLPCAGITLIRFTGLISAMILSRLQQLINCRDQEKHPGKL